MDIAEEFDARLDSPIVLEVPEQWVAEEETRLKSAHVTVADGVTIDDLSPAHVFAHSFGFLLVDP
jgi:hypothetical protein